MSFWDFLFDPANRFFLWGLALIAAVLVLEIIATVVGLSMMINHDVDVDIDHDMHVNGSHDIEWDTGFSHTLSEVTGFGKLPVMVFVVLFVGMFSVFGLATNAFLHFSFPYFMGVALSSLVSFLITVPVTGRIAGFIARILPRDESNAISMEDLLGREATIIVGVATNHINATALVKDFYGVLHQVSVRTLEEGLAIPTKSTVRLEEHTDQGFFYVSPVTN